MRALACLLSVFFALSSFAQTSAPTYTRDPSQLPVAGTDCPPNYPSVIISKSASVLHFVCLNDGSGWKWVSVSVAGGGGGGDGAHPVDLATDVTGQMLSTHVKSLTASRCARFDAVTGTLVPASGDCPDGAVSGAIGGAAGSASELQFRDAGVLGAIGGTSVNAATGATKIRTLNEERHASMFITGGAGTIASPWTNVVSNPIQAALNDLPTTGGRIVLDPGVYDLGTGAVGIDIPKTASDADRRVYEIIGHGSDTTILSYRGTGTAIRYWQDNCSNSTCTSSGVPCACCTGSGTGTCTGAGTSIQSNANVLKGFTLRQASNPRQGVGIWLNYASLWRIEDVGVGTPKWNRATGDEGFAYGIRMESRTAGYGTVDDFVTIERCRFSGNTLSVYADAQADSLEISNNYFEGNPSISAPQDGLRINNSNAVTVIGNVFNFHRDNSESFGLMLSADMTGAQISGNYFEGNKNAIYVYTDQNQDGIVISGNLISTHVVTGGVGVRAGLDGVTWRLRGLHIVGNTFDAIDDAGDIGLRIGSDVKDYFLASNTYNIVTPGTGTDVILQSGSRGSRMEPSSSADPHPRWSMETPDAFTGQILLKNTAVSGNSSPLITFWPSGPNVMSIAADPNAAFTWFANGSAVGAMSQAGVLSSVGGYSGNAATSTRLFANGADCATTGAVAAGVTEFGVAEGCVDIRTNDGAPNEAGDAVSWMKLRDVPAGFADGVDGGGGGGAGDVVGPATATDLALARYDGATGELLQDSAVTVGDAGATVLMTVDVTAGVDPTITFGDNSVAFSTPLSAPSFSSDDPGPEERGIELIDNPTVCPEPLEGPPSRTMLCTIGGLLYRRVFGGSTTLVGGGSSITLDLGDNAGSDPAIAEVATTGDTNSIFTEPSAGKLLVDLANDWPKADTADDLTCSECIGPDEVANFTLGTHTDGNYVSSVADGTGIDGTASGEPATYTPVLDLTEVTNVNWSGGAAATITHTFDVIGVDPQTVYGDDSVTFSTPVYAEAFVSTDPGDPNRGILLNDNDTEPGAPTDPTFNVTFVYTLGGELYKKDEGDGATERLFLTPGNVGGDVLFGQTGVSAIQPDSVALTTDTTGNYVGSVATTAPLSGGAAGSQGPTLTLSIADAAADGVTKGAATFTAADFNAAAGAVSIDYTNGTAATGSVKGFLTAADWTAFNAKLSAETDPGVPLLDLASHGDICAAGEAVRRNGGDTANECFTPSTGGEANVTADVGSGTVSLRGTTPKTGLALNLRMLGAQFAQASDVISLASGVANPFGTSIGASEVDSDMATQAEINLKANVDSPVFTTVVTIPTPFVLGAVSVVPTGTEFNFVDGVTSAIQGQLDGKLATGGTAANSSGLEGTDLGTLTNGRGCTYDSAGTEIDCDTVFLTAEVDASVSNEGSLSVAAGTGTTSVINSNTSGQTGVTITAGTNMTISETGNVITLNATSSGSLESNTKVVTVCASGCDFATVQTAIDGTTGTATDPITILVMPGTYTEKITIEDADDYKSVVGYDKDSVTIHWATAAEKTIECIGLATDGWNLVDFNMSNLTLSNAGDSGDTAVFQCRLDTGATHTTGKSFRITLSDIYFRGGNVSVSALGEGLAPEPTLPPAELTIRDCNFEARNDALYLGAHLRVWLFDNVYRLKDPTAGSWADTDLSRCVVWLSSSYYTNSRFESRGDSCYARGGSIADALNGGFAFEAIPEVAIVANSLIDFTMTSTTIGASNGGWGIRASNDLSAGGSGTLYVDGLTIRYTTANAEQLAGGIRIEQDAKIYARNVQIHQTADGPGTETDIYVDADATALAFLELDNVLYKSLTKVGSGVVRNSAVKVVRNMLAAKDAINFPTPGAATSSVGTGSYMKLFEPTTQIESVSWRNERVSDLLEADSAYPASFKIYWMPCANLIDGCPNETAAAGGVAWQVGVCTVADGAAFPCTVSSFTQVNDTVGTTASGLMQMISGTLPAGALTAGNAMVVTIKRNATDGTNDTLASDATLIGVELSYGVR